MSIHNLSHLFHPATVTLVVHRGAAAPGERALLGNLCRSAVDLTVVGRAGTPPPQDLDPRVRWVPALEAVAPGQDLVVSTLPLAETPDLLAALGPLGARSLLVTRQRSAPGDEALVAAVRAGARAEGIRVLGLNSFGIVAPAAGLNASRFEVQPSPGRVALVSQSGALISTVLDLARERQGGFSHVVSLGSLLDVDFGDVIDYLGWEPEVRCLLLYVENIASVKKFLSACRSVTRAKPIVAIKGGCSVRGRDLIATHTGRPAGEDRVYDTAFRRAGIIRVESIRELLASGEVFSRRPLPRGDRLGVVTNSGGIGVLLADSLDRHGARLADLSPELRARLAPHATPQGGDGNPVCISGNADTEHYVQVLELLLDAGELDTVLVVMALSRDSSPGEVIERLRPRAAARRVELAYLWHGNRAEHGATARRLAARGDVIYRNVEEATTTYCYARRYADNLAKVIAVPPRFDRTLDYRRDEADDRLAALARGGDGPAADRDRQALLGAYGLPLNPTRIAATLGEVTAAAADLGYPVALRAIDPAAGAGTASGTASVWRPRELPGAYRRLGGDGAAVSVQRVEPGVRYQLKLGVHTDVEFGPYLFLGTSGLLPGAPGDETVMLPPLNRLLAGRLIHRSGLAERMDLQPAEAEQLEEVLVRVSQLVVDTPSLRELEIDPLTLGREGFRVQASRLALEDRGVASPHHLVTAPYPNQYEFHETLADGTPVFIRPILPEDTECHHAFVGRLSSRTKYNRFFGFRSELSAEQMARFTQIDYDREVAIVARVEDPQGEVTIGVNRLTYDPHSGRHEFAVVVADAWQGSGVGRLLMEKIVAIAVDRGIQAIEGVILATNPAMLSLARTIGFEVVERDQESLMVRLECAALGVGSL